MPKSSVLTPETLPAEDRIRFAEIPVNAYSRSVADERSVFTPQDFLAIWQDMAAIREFETILSEIKTKRVYRGVAYDHLGPAHLSIGQEASAVGMAFLLTPDDHIYGSHRSHGEILAKGFSAIRKIDERALVEVMGSYRDGAILRPLEKGHRGSVEELAIKFVIFGAFSELFAKETGFNRGMGGSMMTGGGPHGGMVMGDKKDGMMDGEMMKRHEMMEKRMDMMQMMMEQMMQHDQATETMPAK